ncbi:hypothetical protein [Mastigocoleus sp. MO_188.B34]|uniref:hypothetical protein n=1 Tax=Mastigocoleus sp. MO_188.B34 TaxID=3036635 RepID=UPI002638F1D3|nr:hypothetical protein [Mastigocoleus sp. MO_188.B34]MDJ0695419.1 hypothetical protein [Mastigocoleus sp. MO_188.B34]
MEKYSKLYLTKPEQLPRYRQEVSQNYSLEVLDTIANCTQNLSSSTDAEALSQISATLNQISLYLPCPIYSQPIVSNSTEQNEKDYYLNIVDDYMRVIRVQGNSELILLWGILQTYAELLKEALTAGTYLKNSQWKNLRHAFESMLRYLGREAIESLPNSVLIPLTLSTPDPANNDPLNRWVIGHHIFYVLIQSLVVALNCFHTEITSENVQEAEVAITLATFLMWGAESALRFTGDFSASQFQDIVRPSMMPPNAPPGLSGQFSRDHLYLVKLLSELRPTFENLNSNLMMKYRQFVQAFEATYEAHKFVCKKFVGVESQSLRMNSTSSKSAVDVLQDLKIFRLKNLKTRVFLESFDV